MPDQLLQDSVKQTCAYVRVRVLTTQTVSRHRVPITRRNGWQIGIRRSQYARLVQSVERMAVNHYVGSSNLSPSANCSFDLQL